MRDNGVYFELYNQEPERAQSSFDYSLRSFMYDQLQSSFNWIQVTNAGNSEPSRLSSNLQLWMRPTIPWSFDCEGDMNRDGAYEILGKQLDDLNLVDRFWLDALAIIFFAVAPWYAYFNFKKKDLKKNLLWKIEPIVSRLFYLYIFTMLSMKSLEEREQCERNIDSVTKMREMGHCLDKYSQLDTVTILDNLNDAQWKIDVLNFVLR